MNKLIYVKMLNSETKLTMADYKVNEAKHLDKDISNTEAMNAYLEKLKKQKELSFFDLKNGYFTKLIKE